MPVNRGTNLRSDWTRRRNGPTTLLLQPLKSSCARPIVSCGCYVALRSPKLIHWHIARTSQGPSTRRSMDFGVRNTMGPFGVGGGQDSSSSATPSSLERTRHAVEPDGQQSGLSQRRRPLAWAACSSGGAEEEEDP